MALQYVVCTKKMCAHVCTGTKCVHMCTYFWVIMHPMGNHIGHRMRKFVWLCILSPIYTLSRYTYTHVITRWKCGRLPNICTHCLYKIRICTATHFLQYYVSICLHNIKKNWHIHTCSCSVHVPLCINYGWKYVKLFHFYNLWWVKKKPLPKYFEMKTGMQITVWKILSLYIGENFASAKFTVGIA